MDPRACLIRLLEGVRDEDRYEVLACCLDLARWLDMEGILPRYHKWSKTPTDEGRTHITIEL